MSVENKDAEVIQSLVQELNRLKQAATTLEEARSQLALFEELQGKNIENLQGQISELKSALNKKLSEKPPVLPNLEGLFANQDRQEKWLKIEMENIDQRFSMIEKLRASIEETAEITNQVYKESISAGKLQIWLFSWLSLLTLAFIIFLFVHS